ncbi:hypothetical protein F4775DRAFT_271632 [Biscogniauxia sp. FL1348]|nr:hypothetical protein F4775DRAFT_271632 [Biscogniauxia sp. FL1348]
MSAQLPEGSLGVAVGVLIYSLICAICSGLVIWLVWTHHEKTSYVAFLSYFTLLSTIASVIQQCHLIAWWRDNKTIEYYKALQDPDDPELILANLPTEVDRVSFYIQYYSYNVEALLTLFWAGALTQSVYGYTDLKIYRRIRRWTYGVAKSVAVLLPALLIGFLHLDSVRRSSASFIVMADICMIACLTVGAILLLAILGKYVHIRRNALSWHVRYGESGARTEESGMEPWHRNMRRKRTQNIYDRWLLVRFAIAFIVIACFQVSLVVFQGRQLRINSEAEIDLSAGRAQEDFVTFMPGVTASLLTFVVFGTSRPFRETMHERFLPKRFRQRATIPETPAVLGQRTISNPDSALAVEYENQAWRLQDIATSRDASVRPDDDDWPFHSNMKTARIREQWS